MIDATSKTTRAMVVGAIGAAALCSMTMNFRFGVSLGSTYDESIILGAFSVALDILKVLALPLAAIAWAKGFKIKSAALFIIWITAVAYALAAATGFAYTARSAGATERQLAIEEHARNKTEYDRLVADVEIARNDQVFTRTSGCTSVTLPESQEFCTLYLYKTARMEELRDDMAHGAGGDADPQAALFASLTGADIKVIGQWLAIAVAIIAELVSSLGAYAFSRTVREPVRKSKGKPSLKLVA